MEHNVTAQMVPQLRAEMIKDAELGADKASLRRFAAGLGVAELFWVAKDMRQVAEATAKELLPLVMERESLPCSHGILVWEGLVHGLGGFVWETVGPNVILSGLIGRDVAKKRLAVMRQEDPIRAAILGGAFEKTTSWLCPDIDQPVPLGVELTPLNIYMMTMPESDLDATLSVFLPTIAMSLWHLIKETRPSKEMVRPSSAGMKRLKRLNANWFMETRYITLRHLKPQNYEKGESTGDGWHYNVRFEVRAHDRKIKDPSEPSGYRTVKVRAHIRGPEGAPMLNPELKVNRLTK